MKLARHVASMEVTSVTVHLSHRRCCVVVFLPPSEVACGVPTYRGSPATGTSVLLLKRDTFIKPGHIGAPPVGCYQKHTHKSLELYHPHRREHTAHDRSGSSRQLQGQNREHDSSQCLPKRRLLTTIEPQANLTVIIYFYFVFAPLYEKQEWIYILKRQRGKKRSVTVATA